MLERGLEHELGLIEFLGPCPIGKKLVLVVSFISSIQTPPNPRSFHRYREGGYCRGSFAYEKDRTALYTKSFGRTRTPTYCLRSSLIVFSRNLDAHYVLFQSWQFKEQNLEQTLSDSLARTY